MGTLINHMDYIIPMSKHDISLDGMVVLLLFGPTVNWDRLGVFIAVFQIAQASQIIFRVSTVPS